MEVLVSCMNKDIQLAEKMNIKTDAIIINQSKQSEYKFNEYIIKDNKIRFYDMRELGVGRSRNNALMRANSEILITADDDEIFVDDYEQIILSAYKKYPDADMILFDVEIVSSEGSKTKVNKEGKVNYFNYLKYGTVNFTFKRSSIYKKNISYSLMFGGGTPFQSGEDTLFLTDVLKKGLKVYSYPAKIATVYNYDSSWFKGFNSEYLKHRGALFWAISKWFYPLLVLQFAIRKRNLFKDISFLKKIKLMNEGKRMFLNYNFGDNYDE